LASALALIGVDQRFGRCRLRCRFWIFRQRGPRKRCGPRRKHQLRSALPWFVALNRPPVIQSTGGIHQLRELFVPFRYGLIGDAHFLCNRAAARRRRLELSSVQARARERKPVVVPILVPSTGEFPHSAYASAVQSYADCAPAVELCTTPATTGPFAGSLNTTTSTVGWSALRPDWLRKCRCTSDNRAR
jgi:hypothetical protein